MYERYYGLKKKPFSIVPNPEFLYLSPKHQNALTYLEYGLMDGVGFILLTGEVGTGKTTLIRHILNQLDTDMVVAVIFNTNVNADQLIRLILRSYGLPSDFGDKPSGLNTLYEFLIENYANRKRNLLIIDESQNLSDEAMEEVRMLSNLQSDDQVLLQIMLVGQPELNQKLRRPKFAAITQRIGVKHHLTVLGREDSAKYIAFRLRKAGGKPQLFDTDAVDMIYRVSRGVPRSINLICDAALVYGFGYDLKTIGIPVIKQVMRDRGGLDIDLGLSREGSAVSGDTDPGGDREVIRRLEMLEAAVQALSSHFVRRMEELERRSNWFKDKLVARFREHLILERKRRKVLLGEYTSLRKKYKALEKKWFHREKTQAAHPEERRKT